MGHNIMLINQTWLARGESRGGAFLVGNCAHDLAPLPEQNPGTTGHHMSGYAAAFIFSPGFSGRVATLMCSWRDSALKGFTQSS